MFFCLFLCKILLHYILFKKFKEVDEIDNLLDLYDHNCYALENQLFLKSKLFSSDLKMRLIQLNTFLHVFWALQRMLVRHGFNWLSSNDTIQKLPHISVCGNFWYSVFSCILFEIHKTINMMLEQLLLSRTHMFF